TIGIAAIFDLPLEPERLLRGLTFTCNLRDCGGELGGHLWSLSTEEQFYLVFPILFAAGLVDRWRAIIAFVALPVVVIALFIAEQRTIGQALYYFQFILTGVVCAVYEDRIVKLASVAPPVLALIVCLALLAQPAMSETPAGRTVTLLFVPFM